MLVLVTLIFSASVQAQILFGGKGGINVSTLGTSGLYKPRLGYHAALFYSQHLEAQYGWQFELQYSLQGARDAAITNGRLAYHYLSLPVVLKLYFKESVFAEVGPQVSYLAGAKYSQPGFKEDKSSEVRRWDFLGVVGFGYETETGTNMGLRVGVGFLNTSGASVGSSAIFRNLFLQAHVGFKIKELL